MQTVGDDFTGRAVILWGARGHALVLAAAITTLGGQVAALVDNDPTVIPVLADVPLLHGASGLAAFVADRHTQGSRPLAALVAIGGGRGADRRAIGADLHAAGLDLPVLVHPRAFVCAGVSLGAGSQVLGMACVAAGVTVGAACIINHAASVDHECRLGDGVHIAPGATLCGCVDVGQDVFIGAGAVVLPRIRLGRGATVGAGAVVTEDVEPDCTVAGIPARPIARKGDRRR